MNKLFLSGLFALSLFVSCTTQKKAQVSQVPPTVIKDTIVLKTLVDSASYAMGMSAATFYKEQGVTEINTDILTKAIKDVMSGEKTLMDDPTINIVMNKLMTKVEEDKVRPAIDSGNAFLKRNQLRPEVKTTTSGLQYEILTEGTGIKPVATDSVTCQYRGTLIDGTEFDASYRYGQPITFLLSGVIKGWTEGLQLMSEGAKYKFYVPYSLAYGPFDNGPIPGGSALIFEVELVKVKKNTP